jgi:DNA-binding NarL/FixJ family response regulator
MPRFEAVRERAAHYELTRRELEVLRLEAEGLNSQEIGARWHVSDSTVRYHFSNAARKISAGTPVQAGALAVLLGIIRPRARRNRITQRRTKRS